MKGTDNVGATIGRFIYNFYNREKEIDNYFSQQSSDYDEIEIVYYPQVKRITNVLNISTKRKYILEFGSNTPEDEGDKKININDIVVNVINGGIYFKHKETGRRLIFFSNHAVRLDYAPALAQFLLNARRYKYQNTLSLFETLLKLTKYFPKVPRIAYKNIIITEKTWRLENARFKGIKEKDFIEKFKRYAQDINMDRYVFLQEYDTRVLIDILNEDSHKLIYNSYLKNNNILFVENLFKEEQSVMKDMEGNSLISEFIFYFKKNNKTFDNQIRKFNFKELSSTNNSYIPFEKYLYVNIYTTYALEEELLNKYICPFCNKNILEKNIKSFYYIRYKDPKTHIRLRFKLSQDDKEKENFRSQLYQFLNTVKKDNFSQNINFDTYIPETKRYGGDLLFEKMEYFFF